MKNAYSVRARIASYFVDHVLESLQVLADLPKPHGVRRFAGSLVDLKVFQFYSLKLTLEVEEWGIGG